MLTPLLPSWYEVKPGPWSALPGEALPVDARFDRRLEAMLDEAAASGDYADADHRDFDEMEREVIAILEKRRNS
jgi:hypothetical protein